MPPEASAGPWGRAGKALCGNFQLVWLVPFFAQEDADADRVIFAFMNLLCCNTHYLSAHYNDVGVRIASFVIRIESSAGLSTILRAALCCWPLLEDLNRNPVACRNDSRCPNHAALQPSPKGRARRSDFGPECPKRSVQRPRTRRWRLGWS